MLYLSYMKSVIIFLLALLPFGVAAQDISSLNTAGTVALMRHALAPGGGDPADFKLNDCSTQRNLSDRGRAQARAIGQMIRDADIRFDQVWTSQWCRTRETARLLNVGPVIDKPALNSFFQDRSTAQAQRQKILAGLAALPKDAKVLLVTHQVNVSGLAGTSTRSGEIIVAKRNADGTLSPVDRILIAP